MSNRNMVNITITMTREERKALKQLALDEDTTASALIREWLKEHKQSHPLGRWFCLCRHGTPDKAFSRFPGIGRMVCSYEGAQLRGHTWNMYFLNEVEDNFYLLGIPMLAENRDDSQQSNDELLKLFLSAKQVEGCSERSLKYYRTTLC